jgi:hypothetical protein
MKLGLAIAFALTLSGCADLERMNEEHLAQQRASDENQCAGYGYAKGTDAFADCMMKLDHRRQQAQADAARRDAEAKEREKDREAKQAAADQARRDADEARVQKTMETGNLHPDISMPTGKNCKTITTTQQGENAGSMTSTTECH